MLTGCIGERLRAASQIVYRQHRRSSTGSTRIYRRHDQSPTGAVARLPTAPSSVVPPSISYRRQLPPLPVASTFVVGQRHPPPITTASAYRRRRRIGHPPSATIASHKRHVRHVMHSARHAQRTSYAACRLRDAAYDAFCMAHQILDCRLPIIGSRQSGGHCTATPRKGSRRRVALSSAWRRPRAAMRSDARPSHRPRR